VRPTLRAATLFPQLRIKLLADADLSRAEARATEFGAKAASLDTLLGDPEIDVVLNHTTPQAHVPVGLAAPRLLSAATKSVI
jgi:predicted dehydrogenase